MQEKYRWNNAIKIKTKDGKYILEESREPQPVVKPLVFSEVREAHKKVLRKPIKYRK